MPSSRRHVNKLDLALCIYWTSGSAGTAPVARSNLTRVDGSPVEVEVARHGASDRDQAHRDAPTTRDSQPDTAPHSVQLHGSGLSCSRPSISPSIFVDLHQLLKWKFVPSFAFRVTTTNSEGLCDSQQVGQSCALLGPISLFSFSFSLSPSPISSVPAPTGFFHLKGLLSILAN